MTLTQERGTMTLVDYFEGKPRGAKIALARKLGVSKTWLSLIISGRQLPSPELARDIEVHTGRKVKRADLRPDIFGKTAK